MARYKKVHRSVRTKRHRKRKLNYHKYIHLKLKKTKPTGLRISSKAMDVMNSLLTDFLHKVASEAGDLVKANNRMTMTTRDISTALKLVLGGEIGMHAANAGAKAVQKYNNSM